MSKRKARHRQASSTLSRPSSEPAREWPWWVALAIAVLPVCWCQIGTSDAWWHVAIGRALVEEWAWPDFSRFYFTPVRPEIPDLRWEAGGDVLLYLCHRLGGDGGLQALSLAALAAACLLMRGMHSGRMNGWIIALLAAVVVATHQLQLPRNAVLSLPLVALVFWLFARCQQSGRPLWLWSLPPLLALWGVLHGSYLLGLVLVALLLGGDLIDAWRERRPGLARAAMRAAAIVALSFGINVLGNPQTTRMLTAPARSLFGLRQVPQAKAQRLQDDIAPRQAASPTPPPSLKGWLNNLIWPNVPGQVRSGDFASPFDRLQYRPIVVAFALVLLVLGWAALARPVRVSWLLAFAATTFLGLCYLRMTGYAALGAAALFLCGSRLPPERARGLAEHSWIGTALAAFAAVSIWGATAAGRLGALLGYPPHVAGPGKSALFDDAACDWLLQRHPQRKVFTTIVTGSYALFRWAPHKPVFVDGFFAPHPQRVWGDYMRARQKGQLSRLHERYGVELALVEHTRRDWNHSFLASKEWQPVAIGLGNMIYAHQSAGLDTAPELLFPPSAPASLNAEARAGLAYDYYGALLWLVGAGRVPLAQQLIAAEPRHFAELRAALPREERHLAAQLDAMLRGESRAQTAE